MAEVAQYIDHTLLKLDATEVQIDQLCQEARTYNFKSVCVRLPWVPRSVANLQGTPVVVACVVGFHEGTYSTEEKVEEAKQAVAAGASELDMVLNYRVLLAGDASAAQADVQAVRAAAPGAVLKVIVETSQLAADEATLRQACTLAVAAGADFVKTSTGFNGRGASLEDVRVMREAVGSGTSIKASGGVRSLADCKRFIDAGVQRIGASAGVAIIREAQGEIAPGKSAGAAGGGY